jgi:transposase
MLTPEEALALYGQGPQAVIRRLLEQDGEIEALRQRLQTLRKDNEILRQQNEALRQRVEELERRVAALSKNSTNSSKPPSSDDLTKPRPRRRHHHGKGKPGAKPGHPPHERPLFAPEQVDLVHDYHPERCPDCGQTLTPVDWAPKIRQQVELPPIKVIVEEHRAHAGRCEHCGRIHYAPFPPEVEKAGLFKEQLTALVAYLKFAHHASFSTIRKFLRDVLDLSVSRGYLCKVIQKVSEALRQPYEELLARLPLESVINVDETGHKENGHRFWTWVFRADLYALFKIDASRSSQVLIDVLGVEFDGALGCDCFSAYRKYMSDFNIAVQFCLAHLIRDVKYLVSLPDEPTRAYGERLLAALRRLFAVIHRRELMEPADFACVLEWARDHLLKIGIEQAPGQQSGALGKKYAQAQNMAERFRKHGEAFFRFITTPGLSPTNNAAEQALRFVVIDRLVTQGTRSERGRAACERFWTVLATCTLQGRSAFAFILEAVKAAFHHRPIPSLLPLPSG